MENLIYYYSVIITTITIVLLLIASNNRKIIKEKKQELESMKENFISTEKNKVISEILKISLGENELTKSCMSIVNVLLKSFNIDYCSILLVNDRGRHKVVSSSIKDKDEVSKLENFTNQEIRDRKDPIVYYCKEHILDYEFAQNRGIKYYFLIPLEIQNKLIGSLIIEKQDITDKEEFEEDFFNIVISNIIVAIERFKDKDKITAMAMKDGLTNVYNRNYMNRLLVEEMNKHKSRGSSFSIVVFDIDHFKKFNDTYGHLFGDKVLKSLAQFFKNNIRSDDEIFRYGGEEFVLFLPDLKSSKAFKRVDQLREGLSKMDVSMEVDGQTKTVNVTSSFGIAQYPEDSQSIKGLIEKADKAAYYSKRNGRNRVTVYNENLNMIEEK